MPEEFKEVDPQDFLTFSREKPSFTLMEAKLIDIGGGGKDGIDFKTDILRLAGWKYKALTSYGSHAEVAAQAFNKVRGVLAETDEAEQITTKLGA